MLNHCLIWSLSSSNLCVTWHFVSYLLFLYRLWVLWFWASWLNSTFTKIKCDMKSVWNKLHIVFIALEYSHTYSLSIMKIILLRNLGSKPVAAISEIWYCFSFEYIKIKDHRNLNSNTSNIQWQKHKRLILYTRNRIT